MVRELLDAVVSWRTFLIVLVVFGFAPGAVLRLIVLAFRRGDPRRRELLAELHAVPRIERPLWVAEQLEVALFEGIGERVRAALDTLVPILARTLLAWLADGFIERFFAIVVKVEAEKRARPSDEERRRRQYEARRRRDEAIGIIDDLGVPRVVTQPGPAEPDED
jgi:hypothetical protein